jgi:Flp pilus assembly secretin CpaC
MKRVLTAAILLWAGSAVAEDMVAPIELAPGRSTFLRTPSPFRTVSASNPEVADVNPTDQDNAIILLGRSVGTSDLIILDAQGHTVLRTTIVVRDPRQIVVRRPTDRRTKVGPVDDEFITCNPGCIPVSKRAPPPSTANGGIEQPPPAVSGPSRSEHTAAGN